MDYNRYGLEDNPYEGEVLGVEDTDRFAPIHPIDEADLAKRLKTAIQKRRLAVFVVTGTSGSGRTATAHHIMGLHKTLHAGQDPASSIAFYERLHDGNVDPRQVAREVLGGLGDEVKRLGAYFKDTPAAELRAGLAGLGANYTTGDLQSLARDFSDAVHNRHATYACSVENVPSVEVFTGIRAMFEKSQGLLVFTVIGEQRKAVLGSLQAEQIGHEYLLDNLTDDGACELARQRWQKANARPPLPFEMTGLRKAFHDKPRTVGKSLKTLSYMIDSKLANYPGATFHPDDPGLGFDEQQIRWNFERFDKGFK